jgi:predicted site-specific integrase-resolvase
LNETHAQKGNAMTVYGYARVSSSEQTLAGQDADLRKAGAAKVYREKISGVAARRPQLEKLLHIIGRDPARPAGPVNARSAQHPRQDR